MSTVHINAVTSLSRMQVTPKVMGKRGSLVRKKLVKRVVSPLAQICHDLELCHNGLIVSLYLVQYMMLHTNRMAWESHTPHFWNSAGKFIQT